MTVLLGWLPFIINLFLVAYDIAWIFTLPFSIILGCIIVAIYYKAKKNGIDPKSEEYEYYDRKQKEWTGAAIAGTISAAKSIKKGVDETMDPDKWTTKF